MANTHGFEVIAELTVNTLKQLLKAAWKSGGDNSDAGVIPEYINIPGPRVPAPVSFGPYTVASGHIQIPQEQLDLEMDTAVNGIKVKLGTIIQVEIANPPIDSAKFFDMTADISVRTPIRIIGSNFELGADFTAMPADGVTVNITSGDPIGPITNAAVEEFVHKKYQDGSIPHLIDGYPISFGAFNMKARIEFYDDSSDPAKKILVANQDATHVKISIPTYIRFYEITGSMFGYSLATPMGIKATTVMVAEYTSAADKITANLPGATVELTNLAPADGFEGSNYTSNKSLTSLASYDLDAIIKSGFNSAASDKLRGHDPIVVEIPTLLQIQNFIAEKVKAELLFRQRIQVWKVVDPSGTTTIMEVRPKAIANAFAICINPGSGADENAVTYFVPGSRDFAIATSAGKVQTEFNKQRDEQYGTLPTTLSEPVKGKTVKLNSLNLGLETGYLNVTGGVTVVNAVLDSIDVDADFSQKVTLTWEDQPDGTQMLKHVLDGDPDVHMSTWAEILVVIIGVLTFGIIGGIIAAIILVVVNGIASDIGGNVARDESGKVTGIGAWPEHLDNIGNVKARFENPVIIETDGLVFAGNMIISSSYALTSIDMARSHGPYFTSGNIPVNLNGGVDKISSVPLWKTGDGKTFNVRNTTYRYGKSGLYIAKVQIQVTEAGGATTKHFASVKVSNVPPKVHFDLTNITIKEGEEVELKGTFTDDDWLDTHTAWIDFGDNTKTEEATIIETNNEPQAQGQFSIKHAWCDNGIYQVHVKIEDSAGGIGESDMTVTVLNVAPTVFTYKTMCVIKDQPVRLEAVFTDPGWCDTHVGTWDCGDGNIKMATIKEKHESPKGIGIASVSHIYKCLGTYLANVVVIDDDGGKGMAFLLVTVNELMNKGFENGFRFRINKDNRALSDAVVGNEWQSFAEPIIVLDVNQKSSQNFNAVYFMPDEFICRDGQRSQGLKLDGTGIAGVRQTICTNIGWDYEFTAFYHLPVSAQGVAVIGIDPTGGVLATSDKVVWVRSLPVNEWVHISVRVTAKSRLITCFIGVQQETGQSEMYIDKTRLFMIQPCDPISLIMKPEKNDEQRTGDQMQHNDFSEIETFMALNLNAMTIPAGTYQPSFQGVRFVDAENPAPRFQLDKQTFEKAVEILAKGAFNMAVNLVKQTVGATLGRILPFMDNERKC
jgi:PKD domain